MRKRARNRNIKNPKEKVTVDPTMHKKIHSIALHILLVLIIVKIRNCVYSIVKLWY